MSVLITVQHLRGAKDAAEMHLKLFTPGSKYNKYIKYYKGSTLVPIFFLIISVNHKLDIIS